MSHGELSLCRRSGLHSTLTRRNEPMNKIRSLLLALLLVVFAPIVALGQTALTATTVSEAVDATETRINIASTTNVAVDDIAFLDREAMLVVAVNTTQVIITVQRGYAGTVADDHANSTPIFIDRPNRFISTDLAGACTAGSEFPNFTPLINISNGKRYDCINSLWAEIGWQAKGVVQLSETTTAVDVLTAQQCGETIFLNNATGYLTTLPIPSAGCYFKVVLVTLLTSGDHTVATNASANIIIGGVNELEVDTADDGPSSTVGDLITFVGSAETLGDYVELISDGTSWFLNGQTTLDGGITIGST